nr:hypothetical protein [Candidatus Sigynarchaeota archaeon]
MSAFSTLEITIYNLIFVALAYSIIILQKEGAMKVPKFGDEKTTSVIKGLVKNKTWLAGVILNIIAIPYTTFLLSISSLSFMMIFHRAGIIIVFVYAFRTLKEKISRDEIIGLVILYTGFVLVLFVLQVETTGAFTGGLQGLIFFSTCGIMYVVTYIGFKKARSRVKAKEVILSVGAGFSGIGGTLALKVI